MTLSRHAVGLFWARLVVAAWIVAPVMPAGALTLPIYQATASATSRPIVTNAGSLGASADNGVAFPGDGRGSSVQASASRQGLKVFATAGTPQQPPKDPFGSLSVAAGGSAQMRFDDLVFSRRDAEVPEGLIPVSLNLAMDGSFSLLQQGTSNASARGGVTVSYGLGLPGPGSTAIPKNIANLLRERDRGNSLASNNGFFDVLGSSDAWIVDGVFRTPTFLVPVDTPLLLTVILNASATAVTRDGAPVNAVTAFDHTLRFPLDGPVFNLPEGYSVDSLQAGIVDNVSAVPLPPTLWLFVAGLAAIGLRQRHRATRRTMPASGSAAVPAARSRALVAAGAAFTTRRLDRVRARTRCRQASPSGVPIAACASCALAGPRRIVATATASIAPITGPTT